MCHTFIANRRGKVCPGSSGTVVPGYDAMIVDEAGRAVPPGEIGNLLVKGDSACAGYWNQHERSQQTFVGEWVRTGDKYRQDAAGCFWYAGRSDDMIKAGGMWVSPAEVESALAEHPAGVEAGVVGTARADPLAKAAAVCALSAAHPPSPALVEVLQGLGEPRLPRSYQPSPSAV